MQEQFNKKIEETLGSLEGIQKASPAPYFFTRLEARMQREKSIWDKITSFITTPAIAVGSICFIFLVNVAVIFSSAPVENTATSQNEIAAVDEYSQLSSTFYEFENVKP